jgi:hypothetical protein
VVDVSLGLIAVGCSGEHPCLARARGSEIHPKQHMLSELTVSLKATDGVRKPDARLSRSKPWMSSAPNRDAPPGIRTAPVARPERSSQRTPYMTWTGT